jgi:Zn-finger nucleic acid-binding protein
MRVVHESGVSIDVCDICHGVWLDAGELDQLACRIDFTSHRFKNSSIAQLSCPQCATSSFASIETPRGEFVICIDCKGVFVAGATFDELAALGNESKRSSKVANGVLETPSILASLGDLLVFFG